MKTASSVRASVADVIRTPHSGHLLTAKEEEERRGEAATSIRRRESGKNSDYLQTTRFLLPPPFDDSISQLISFHSIVLSIQFELE